MTLLKEMMSRILFVLFLFSFSYGQSDEGTEEKDLCSQSSTGFADIFKRLPYFTTNKEIDDSVKENGFYVDSNVGSLLDYPPGVGRCGGMYPIWQKELKNDSAVVCIQNEDDTCFKEFEVNHQKCEHYSMYDLRTEVKGSVFCIQPNFCMTTRFFCKNGGTCINERDGFSCRCPDGFSGPTCEGDPCSISEPLPRLHERLPSNHVVNWLNGFLRRDWYSVPKGVKILNRLPSVPSCGSKTPGWSIGRLGNIEVLCQEFADKPCKRQHVTMSRMCADTSVFSLPTGGFNCFECRPGPLDILVIEDVSSSIMNNDYQKMKDFILENIRVLNISRTNNNVAFLSFASKAKVGFHLNTHSNIMDVLKAIAFAHGEGGGTLVSTALELSASDVFTYHNGDRADADNIVLLFTDGLFKDDTSLEQDIETLKAKAEVYVVTVGPVVSNSTLVEMATTLDHILRLGDPSTATVITSALNPDPTCGVGQQTLN